jgi:hyaluronoglucosaminidase
MNRFFGYIEGYYGRILSWEDRGAILSHMERLSLNTYLYAPKEDPFHRIEWRKPYPDSWVRSFQDFTAAARKKHVSVIPSLAPGLSFDYNDNADYALLLKKFFRLAASGATAVALLMDDIPMTSARFTGRTSLGEAHGMLLTRLRDDLASRFPHLTLWFCPTIYSDALADTGVKKCRYLVDCSRTMPRDVITLWTGPAVVSERLDGKNVLAASDLFCGNIVIWDNLYANDYCPHRLFFGPYEKRSRDLDGITKGIMLNPTGLVHTDCLLLSRVSGYKKHRPPAGVWKAGLHDFSFKKQILAVSRFFNSPFTRITARDMTPDKIKTVRKALRSLLWDWKSPLQREWYPYLYMLDTDISLLQKTAAGSATEEWIMKKYPPVLSLIVSGKAESRRRRAP